MFLSLSLSPPMTRHHCGYKNISKVKYTLSWKEWNVKRKCKWFLSSLSSLSLSLSVKLLNSHTHTPAWMCKQCTQRQVWEENLHCPDKNVNIKEEKMCQTLSLSYFSFSLSLSIFLLFSLSITIIYLSFSFPIYCLHSLLYTHTYTLFFSLHSSLNMCFSERIEREKRRKIDSEREKEK